MAILNIYIVKVFKLEITYLIIYAMLHVKYNLSRFGFSKRARFFFTKCFYIATFAYLLLSAI